jgi:hypothetical protein
MNKNHQRISENKVLDKIKREIISEFPDDEALQQVHIARKIISLKAKASNLSYFDYVKSLVKK